MNIWEFSDMATVIWGWLLIGLIAISLLSVWAITLPKVIREFYTNILNPDVKKVEEETLKAKSSMKIIRHRRALSKVPRSSLTIDKANDELKTERVSANEMCLKYQENLEEFYNTK